METKQFDDAARAFLFILAGKSTVTFVSKATGKRLTFKVTKADGGDIFFVSLLTAPETYTYVGIITSGNDSRLKLTAKSKFTDDSAPVKAFQWTYQNLRRLNLPETVEVWHEGRCGRCNRKLTVPSSIDTGFGPECVKIHDN